MEAIHPINSFKAMSTKQKVATVTAAAATTAAIVSIPVAYAKGKNAGEEKFFKALGAGYRKMGGSVMNLVHKIFKPKEAEKASEAAAAATEKAGDAVAQGATEKAAQAVEGQAEKAAQAVEGQGVKVAAAVEEGAAEELVAAGGKKVAQKAVAVE